jgi:hypothetical protein
MARNQSPRRAVRASHGPRPQVVQKGSALLVIDGLLPESQRPVQVTLEKLERFSALMAEQAWPAQVSRLAYDRIYAHERFDFARRVGTGALPALAMELLWCWRASRQSRRRAADR